MCLCLIDGEDVIILFPSSIPAKLWGSSDCILLPRPQLFLGSNGCSLLLLATGYLTIICWFLLSLPCLCNAPQIELGSLIPSEFWSTSCQAPDWDGAFGWAGKWVSEGGGKSRAMVGEEPPRLHAASILGCPLGKQLRAQPSGEVVVLWKWRQWHWVSLQAWRREARGRYYKRT